jgi:uncharacterized membrane protein YgcG
MGRYEKCANYLFSAWTYGRRMYETEMLLLVKEEIKGFV